MDLSIVIGSIAASRSIRACITSLVESCTGLAAEVIVVDASTDDTASIVRSDFPGVRLICLPPGTLTPILWSTGIASAGGSRIATTTGHCTVSSTWARDLLTALDSGAAGAGGPMLLRADASLLDRAIYFLRYSAFLPSSERDIAVVSEIAGDNAMYDSAVLRDHTSASNHGFWEVELHDALRSKRRELLMVEGASAEFGDSFPLGLISRHRFEHGRHFGKWRVRAGYTSPVRVVLASPFVPLVLLLRIARRVMRSGSNRLNFVAASPLVLWLAICWAFGEAIGAAESRRKAPDTTTLEAKSANRD